MSGADAIEVVIATPEQIPICHAIRRTVFIEGQGVPEEIELDGRDDECVLLLARRVGGPWLGTARVMEIEDAAGRPAAKAQRVAVLESDRGTGIGRALMERIEAIAAESGLPRVLLHAQEEAVTFYLRLGFKIEGERFIEAGLPHFAMSIARESLHKPLENGTP